MKAHCLFEQSGTFKNAFIKNGIPAYDYDIQNDFGQTDYVIDLFSEIDKGYAGKESIFDGIEPEDIIIAFFPCTRFETKIQMWFKGNTYSQRNWTDLQKLERAMKLHKELSRNYELISKLACVALKRELRLIIENPKGNPHYLTEYWPLEPALIDMNRRKNGDYQKKPTQYWFINLKPRFGLCMEALDYVEYRNNDNATGRDGVSRQVIRSMIHPQYADRFIRQYILEDKDEQVH